MNFHYLEDVLLIWKLINYGTLFFACTRERAGNCQNVKSQPGKIPFEAMFYDQFEFHQRKKQLSDRNANKNAALRQTLLHTCTIGKQEKIPWEIFPLCVIYFAVSKDKQTLPSKLFSFPPFLVDAGLEFDAPWCRRQWIIERKTIPFPLWIQENTKKPSKNPSAIAQCPQFIIYFNYNPFYLLPSGILRKFSSNSHRVRLIFH